MPVVNASLSSNRPVNCLIGMVRPIGVSRRLPADFDIHIQATHRRLAKMPSRCDQRWFDAINPSIGGRVNARGTIWTSGDNQQRTGVAAIKVDVQIV